MNKITILALNTASATTITAPMDVFQAPERFFDKVSGAKNTHHFEVEVVSPDGKPVVCANQLSIAPHRAMDEVTNTDLIIIPAVWDIEATITGHKHVVSWLQEKSNNGIKIAAICTGVFLLAETGLLDNKEATTHWGVTDMFSDLYPNVNLRPERLFTDAGDLFCCGAFSACIDLSLYLVAKFSGYEMAIKSSKMLVYDIGRISQSPYVCFNFQRNHTDEAILQIQYRLEKEFSNNICINDLVQDHGMSRRTLERRFKNATGDTPLLYLQRVRVEEAKKVLEISNDTIDEISYKVGYEDCSFFRKVFKKNTGLLPGQYRSKFKRVWDFRSK